MREIVDLVHDFVKRPVVAMPPAISVAQIKETYGLDSVVKFCSNENPFGVSPKAVEAMQDELQNTCFYADPEPEEALRAKVAKSIGMTAQNIMITSGAAFALSFVGEAFLQIGDEGIVSSPTYPPYYSIIQKNGGKVIDVPMTKEMEFDFNGILGAITEKTKIIFICNPNNPTGCTVYRDTMQKFVERVPANVVLVMDEAYVQFAKDPQALTMIPAIANHQNIIVVQTFSKLYGLAGIRVGYAVSTPEIITFLHRESIVRSLNCVGIRGAFAAMDDVEFAKKTIENNSTGRDYLTAELTALGHRVYPSESNFIYVDMGVDPQEITNRLLPFGVVIRGSFPCLRISICTAEQNAELVDAIKEIMIDLPPETSAG